MSVWLGDYNRLLAFGIWLFFAVGLFMLKEHGHGVAYLGPGRMRVRFPSWRAALGRRLVLVAAPLQSFWPVADVQLLADSRQGALDELHASAQQLARSIRFARPLLMLMTVILILVIPVWVLTRGADLIFLLLVALAYLLYLSALLLLVLSGDAADRQRMRRQWKILLEPLLCLPYAPHLCRKLSERYQLSVPLADVVHSDLKLADSDLYNLSRHIGEYREICDDARELALLDGLTTLIEQRLDGHTQ